jgi:hypothetical protein
MANKLFTQTEVLDRIAADSDSEVEIESEDDGWPSSDDESSDVDNVPYTMSRSLTLTSYDPEWHMNRIRGQRGRGRGGQYAN